MSTFVIFKHQNRNVVAIFVASIRVFPTPTTLNGHQQLRWEFVWFFFFDKKWRQCNHTWFSRHENIVGVSMASEDSTSEDRKHLMFEDCNKTVISACFCHPQAFLLLSFWGGFLATLPIPGGYWAHVSAWPALTKCQCVHSKQQFSADCVSLKELVRRRPCW